MAASTAAVDGSLLCRELRGQSDQGKFEQDHTAARLRVADGEREGEQMPIGHPIEVGCGLRTDLRNPIGALLTAGQHGTRRQRALG